MEDNEFEEVTIISHTSEEPSVLPESTAQRFLKSLRIEITQTAKPSSNDRLGKLRRSKQPTELDFLFKEAVKVKPSTDIYCLSRGVKEGYLFGCNGAALVLQRDKTWSLDPKDEDIKSYHILQVKESLIIFAKDAPLLFVHQGEVVHRSTHKFGGSPSNYVLHCNENVYFLNQNLQIVMIDPDWTEREIIPHVVPADFIFDPQLELLIVLTIDGFIISKKQTHRISFEEEYHTNPFTNIACGYRKYYLAIRLLTEKGSCEITLIEKWKSVLDVQEFPSEDATPVSQIRFASPRLSFHPVLIVCGRSVRLFAIYLGHVYRLHDVKLSSFVFCLSYLYSTWVAAGESTTLTALKLNWGKTD